jgi:hypothetical protein
MHPLVPKYTANTPRHTWGMWDMWGEMSDWCNANVGKFPIDWNFEHTGSEDVGYTFYFHDPAIAMRFKLIWG